jgi:hypothetical protein
LLPVREDGTYPAVQFGPFLPGEYVGKRIKKHGEPRGEPRGEPPPNASAFFQAAAFFMDRMLFNLIDPVYPGMNSRIFTAFNTLCGDYI